jgi:D-methionine transport system permease protein
MIEQITIATLETLYMTMASGIIATLFGLPLGIILLVTKKNGILENMTLNNSLAALVNATRSIPFIILLIAIVPFTRFLIGTSIGTTAAVVPLTIGAIPFIARIVENAMSEVNPGLIEAGLAMGATPLQIIRKILLPESLVAIVNGLTVVLISLIGYSAMAGVVGGGGLGDLAIRYGYQRFNLNIMLTTIIVLIVIVQLIQFIGDRIANKISHKTMNGISHAK